MSVRKQVVLAKIHLMLYHVDCVIPRLIYRLAGSKPVLRRVWMVIRLHGNDWKNNMRMTHLFLSQRSLIGSQFRKFLAGLHGQTLKRIALSPNPFIFQQYIPVKSKDRDRVIAHRSKIRCCGLKNAMPIKFSLNQKDLTIKRYIQTVFLPAYRAMYRMP